MYVKTICYIKYIFSQEIDFMKNRTEYFTQYKKKNYKRIPLDVSKEKYDQIKAHADHTKETVNGFIKRAIDETLERDIINNSEE